MATFEKEVAQYLAAQGFGTLGSTIFLGKQSEKSDNQVMVRDTGGAAPDAHTPLKERTVQVIVRNTNKETCDNTANSIRDLLHNRFWTDITTGGTNFQLRSSALQEPTPIGQDANQRYENSCNYLFLIR